MNVLRNCSRYGRQVLAGEKLDKEYNVKKGTKGKFLKNVAYL